jgi:hypothetical protein
MPSSALLAHLPDRSWAVSTGGGYSLAIFCCSYHLLPRVAPQSSSEILLPEFQERWKLSDQTNVLYLKKNKKFLMLIDQQTYIT